MTDHVHYFEALYDDDKARLFAFCTSGGIAECNLEIEVDEIDRRINAAQVLSAEDARVIAQAHEGKTRAILRAYAEAREGE